MLTFLHKNFLQALGMNEERTSVARRSGGAVSQMCLHQDVGKIYIFSLSPPSLAKCS